MKTLQLSKDLSLPVEAVTETFGLLAVRGAGKSNAARVLAEEMFAAGIPFVAVDPVGSWWGLRSSRDGKSAGLPVPVFGGKHGDVPLEKGGGQLLADLVVDQRLSCVLDLSGFDSEASKKAFLLDFARRLYQRNEEPLHLFLEEADDYIPQRPMRDEAQLLRAWENIVRRGRARGLGMTLITQRSASINKNVLTQVQTLIALRTTGPQDRAAIEEWLKYHAQAREVLESLPSLDDGEAWVWSPRFLAKTVRTRFRLSKTLDSGATPKLGKASRAPATLADVDLAGIRERMAATIEKAKAEDPRALRARVAQLERELAAARKGAPAKVDPAATEKAVERERVHFSRVLDKTFADVKGRDARIVDGLKRVMELLSKPMNGVALPKSPAPRLQEPRPSHASPIQRPRAEPAGGALPKGERKILLAVAQHQDGVSREQLTVLTGYKRSSRDTYLQRLRTAGHVEERGDTIVATEAGISALGGDFEPLPTGSALLDHWLGRLPEGERKVLEVVVAAHPDGVARAAIDEATGYRRSSRDTYLQRLRSRKLVEEAGRGEVRASGMLFG